jgi:aspartyl aminopeptidase
VKQGRAGTPRDFGKAGACPIESLGRESCKAQPRKAEVGDGEGGDSPADSGRKGKKRPVPRRISDRYNPRMIHDPLQEARALLAYIDACPSSFHAVAHTARLLHRAGFEEIREKDAWTRSSGRLFTVRAGAVVAWVLDGERPPETGFGIVGAHTDSPSLRIKPHPDLVRNGYRQLGVEVYGGPLVNSWLDRDLGLSGRVFLRKDGELQQRIFRIDRPILRVPQLAIHLDREIGEKGLRLNKQKHLVPIWGLDDGTERGFRDLLAEELGVEGDTILSWDAFCHDTAPSRLVGAREEMVSAPRLDDLCSCFCGLEALLHRAEQPSEAGRIPMLCLFDHEEIGSNTDRGAGSPLLGTLIERSILSRGGNREDYHRALTNSVCVSADMAHATHPNYADRHESSHHLELNRGPVIKINANHRYATEAETEAIFQDACERAEVPYQKWVNRTDLACGSTIGPITAGRLGIRTLDVGNAQLAMHSIRELCGALDPSYMTRAMAAFYA